MKDSLYCTIHSRSRSKKRMLFMGFMIVCILAVCGGCQSQSPNDQSPNDHVYSHRGASGEELEHTFDAYDLAILYGSKYIEQDLVLSKDGTLYVSHDSSALRLTGVDSLWSDMTDAEIDDLRTLKGEYRILRMSDVFRKYRDSVMYVIELKKGLSQVEYFEKLLKEYEYEENIIVQCFDSAALEALEVVYPDMKKLYLVTKQEEFDAALDLDYVDIIGVGKSLMNSINCRKAHKAGKEFNVWTLNSMEEIREAIALDVDTYFTNYTAKALVLEENYRTD